MQLPDLGSCKLRPYDCIFRRYANFEPLATRGYLNMLLEDRTNLTCVGFQVPCSLQWLHWIIKIMAFRARRIEISATWCFIFGFDVAQNLHATKAENLPVAIDISDTHDQKNEVLKNPHLPTGCFIRYISLRLVAYCLKQYTIEQLRTTWF